MHGECQVFELTCRPTKLGYAGARHDLFAHHKQTSLFPLIFACGYAKPGTFNRCKLDHQFLERVLVLLVVLALLFRIR